MENTANEHAKICLDWFVCTVSEDHSHSVGSPASGGGKTAVILSGRGSYPSAGLAGLLDYTAEWHERERETLLNIPLN